MIEEQKVKAAAETSPEVLELRAHVRKRKRALISMRTLWHNVRELAKKGMRSQSVKEAANIRAAIVSICEEALFAAGTRPDSPKAANEESTSESSSSDTDSDGRESPDSPKGSEASSQPTSPRNGRPSPASR